MIHILTGDALGEQFPKNLAGQRIIARECLIDGPVHVPTLQEFYDQRAHFLATTYKACTPEEYATGSKGEFEKIRQLPPKAEIHLWFEDDLFCQVNAWFVCSLLSQTPGRSSVYLVRPDTLSPYGFGAYTPAQLLDLYQNKTALSPEDWAPLWTAYAAGDHQALQYAADALPSAFQFVHNAVTAYKSQPDLPLLTLKSIVKELNTKSLGPVFQEFQKRLPIYGYGDLQVARLLNEIET